MKKDIIIKYGNLEFPIFYEDFSEIKKATSHIKGLSDLFNVMDKKIVKEMYPC